MNQLRSQVLVVVCNMVRRGDAEIIRHQSKTSSKRNQVLVAFCTGFETNLPVDL